MGTTLDRKPVQSVFHLRSVVDDPSALDAGSFAEKHYRIGELAERWGLGRETVRKLVKMNPESSRFGKAERRRIQPTPFRNPSHEESTPGCRTSLEIRHRIERRTRKSEVFAVY